MVPALGDYLIVSSSDSIASCTTPIGLGILHHVFSIRSYLCTVKELTSTSTNNLRLLSHRLPTHRLLGHHLMGLNARNVSIEKVLDHHHLLGRYQSSLALPNCIKDLQADHQPHLPVHRHLFQELKLSNEVLPPWMMLTQKTQISPTPCAGAQGCDEANTNRNSMVSASNFLCLSANLQTEFLPLEFGHFVLDIEDNTK